MLFNGEGVAKDEAGAGSLFLKAARRGSPIAQNRLARMLAVGRGLPADPVQAIKWHLIAKAAGAGDLFLDDFVQKQSTDARARAEKEAKPWLALIAASRS
jgi:TPR repeat protein